MRQIGKLFAALALTIVALAAPVQAQADPGVTSHYQVHGYFEVAGASCYWSNAQTSDNPPTALFIFQPTVHISYPSPAATSATLDNNPIVTFDVTRRTATVHKMVFTLYQGLVSCRYEVVNLLLDQLSTSTEYVGYNFPASVIGPCPPVLDHLTLSFT